VEDSGAMEHFKPPWFARIFAAMDSISTARWQPLNK
jgi:hypothetical protein